MSQVQQVKDATDIVQVIGERLKLQRSGSNYKAVCPFHGEKTPSFFVNDQLQRYRCFGCGESGDVLEFLQKYDGMSFGEALKELADQAGIELEEYQRTKEDDQRERLLEVLNLAKEYYHYLLTEHKVGQTALKYLKDRGITQESIKIFQLGYAQSGWDGLIKYLNKKKKYSLDDLQAAGLIIRGRGGRYYDRFRGRVMFPLRDHRGRVVGFSGRLLDKNPKEAKYINTPETILYHKSKMLFGFKELMQEIKKADEVIVVEGEMDVITSAQAHVNNIVAIKGSALTKEQVKLLSRIVKRVILSLDADGAGEKATKRAIEVAKDSGLELRVIDLSNIGLEHDQIKDVDDLARAKPKKWREVAESSVSVYEFLLQLALRKHDESKPEGKRKIVVELAPILGHIPHAVEQDFYLQKLAKALNIQKSLVKQDIMKFKDNGLVGRTTNNQTKTSDQQRETGNKDVKKEPDKLEKLEKYLVFLAFEGRNQVGQKLKQMFTQDLVAVGLKQALEFVSDKIAKQSDKNKVDLKIVTAGLAEDLKALLFDILYDPNYNTVKDLPKLDEEWQKTWQVYVREQQKKKITKLTKEMEKLDSKLKKTATEEKRMAELLREVVQLQRG